MARWPAWLCPTWRMFPRSAWKAPVRPGRPRCTPRWISSNAGRGRIALVVGAEKMTAVPTAQVGDILLGGSYRKEEGDVQGGFAGVFGRIAEAYFQRHGDRSEELALIAAKNHANGVANPFAHMRKDLGFAYCNTVSEKNPRVAGPLRRTDCSLVSDGAAVLVLADEDTARGLARAIGFRARSSANDAMALSRRADILAFEGPRRAWAAALAAAGLTLDDLSLVETHDCFTIAELLEYEAMGLAEPGQGWRVVRDGTTLKGGRLPINPSGGLKAKGHPIGATGVSMHVMAAMQLMGEAGGMQIPGADLAGGLQHGRRSGDQLRLHPGARQMSQAEPTIVPAIHPGDEPGAIPDPDRAPPAGGARAGLARPGLDLVVRWRRASMPWPMP